MSVSHPIPATVEIRRGRLFGLVGAVAALAVAVTWSLAAFAFDGGSSTTTAATPAIAGYMSYFGPHPAAAGQHTGVNTVHSPSIMSLTPAGLAANALGTGYTLPTAKKDRSVESVLASMNPQTREYTKRIMNLTFSQLAAGAAGQP